jgi:hypothetical protein
MCDYFFEAFFLFHSPDLRGAKVSKLIGLPLFGAGFWACRPKVI